MHISRILTLAGPNVWSRKGMLEIRLEHDDASSQPATALNECRSRLYEWCATDPEEPGAPSAPRTRFAQRIAGAHSRAELFAHVVLHLQNLAGTPVADSIVEVLECPRVDRVAVEFVEDAVARLAVRLAYTLIAPDPTSPVPDVAECRRALRDCAYDACFGATTGPIVAAARQRGIPVFRLDGDCLLQLGHGAKQRRVQGVITGGTGYLAEAISRDKLLTKRLMRQLGLPTAEGRLVRDADDAWAAACEIGLPVVVKPRAADYGNGVSVHLLTKAQVVAGWEAARQYGNEVIVERHLAGVPHRLLIVGDALVAAVRRDPAHVIGDGQQSVKELIAQANRDPRRGDGPEFPWFLIRIDERLLQVVARQGLHLESIPASGQLVTLQYDPQTCYADMIHDVTEIVHPDVSAAARDAVRLTGLDVAGVDVMATDIARPLVEQDGGILEVNAGPAIYLHRSPMCHPPRPVPEAVVESLIPAPETGRIPIVAIVGDGRATAVARAIGEALQHAGCVAGVSGAAGITVGGRVVTATRADDYSGCTALLLHPRVEAAVCEISAASIRDSGLAFDQCHVVVLTGRTANPAEPGEAQDSEQCLQVAIGAASPGGKIIANMDDLDLASIFRPGDDRLIAAACTAAHPFLKQHALLGGRCAFFDGADAVIVQSSEVIMRQPRPDPADAGDEESVTAVLAIAAAWAPAPFSLSPWERAGVRAPNA